MKVTFTDIDNQKTSLDVASKEEAAAAIKAHIDGRLAQRQKLQAEEEANPATPVSDSAMGNLVTGFDRGVTNVGRRLGNMVGLVSDESIRESDRLDQPLLRTKAGITGDIIGSTAVTAPLTAGVGGAAAKLSARAASPLAQALIQGGTAGAVLADPGSRIAGAVGGAAIGGGLHGAARGLSRTVRGLATPKPEAAAVMDKGVDLPLHMAAESGGLSGGLKTLYSDVVRAIPGAGGRISKQEHSAKLGMDLLAAAEALPKSATNVLKGSTNVRDTMQRLSSFWDNAWDDVKALKFLDPTDEIVSSISTLPKNVRTKALGLATRQGADLMRLRNEIANPQVRDAIDKYILSNLSRMSRGLPKRFKGLADKYAELIEANKSFRTIQRAVDAAASEGGEFSMSQLAQASTKEAGNRAVSTVGKGPLQRTADALNRAAGHTVEEPGFFQRRAVLMPSLVGGAGFLGGAPGVAGLLGAGQALSPMATQKALMGRTAAQRALAEFLRKNAKQLRQAGTLGRTAVVSGVNR